MSEYFPFSDEVLQDYIDTKNFNSLLKDFIFNKQQYDRGLYGSAVTQRDLDNYKLMCQLLYNDMERINPEKAIFECSLLGDNIYWFI